MMYLGDYAAGETIHFMWNSNDSNGASITRSTNGTISVYKDDNTTQTTTGVTDTEDFDTLTGVHHVKIATTDGFYTTATDFMVVLSAATIDTRTVNAVLAHFSIENRSALRPTTAGRTLDVSAGGEAGVDWANVGSPTTTVGLSGTTVKTATDVETDTADIQTRLPAALVSGRMDSSVGAMAANVVTAAALAADAGGEIADAVWDEAILGHATAGTFGEQCGTDIDAILVDTGTTLQGEVDGIQADTEDIQSRLPAALVSGRIDASVGAMAANTLTASAVAADAVTEIQAGLSTLDAAGVRSAVGLASANLDTQLSAIDDFIDTEVAAILAAVDTEVAAIKAKTDQLVFTVAGQVDATTVTNSDKTGYRLSATGVDDVHDEVVDGSLTHRQSMRLANAANAGKVSGAATTTVTIRNPGDTIDRVVATVDADGNRTAVTTDVS